MRKEKFDNTGCLALQTKHGSHFQTCRAARPPCVVFAFLHKQCIICWFIVSSFFFHQMIDAVNVHVEKWNAVFVQAEVIVKIVSNQFRGGTVQG